ncbi:MAG: HEPN domain-containing protein [Nanoarchaeota archaeon]
MSQAKDKVEWCLRKAKKELEASSKHRGLVAVQPSRDEAKRHVIKAEHDLKAAISFESTGFSDWSVSAAFYSIYHCFLAIISTFGYASRNQECTIALVEHLKEAGKISISDEIIGAMKDVDIEEQQESKAISLRETYQYGTATSIEDNKLAGLKQLCRQAIEETKKIVYT